MRLSSTPPNNFCKASVNQSSSLQQRQGMKVPEKVEKKLAYLFDTTHITFLKQIREQAPNLYDYAPHARGVWYLEGLPVRDFRTTLQALQNHGASQHLTLAVESAANGFTHTLKVMSPSGKVVYGTQFNNETTGDVSRELSYLLEDLPSLVETHPKPRPWEKFLSALRSSSTT